MQKQNLGNQGEQLALDYLKRKGYRFLDRNVSSPFGEIDLIFRDSRVLVFVEVKTRTSRLYGLPEQAVNAVKLRSITKTAYWYCQHAKTKLQDMRIDVIAVEVGTPESLTRIRHYKNVSNS